MSYIDLVMKARKKTLKLTQKQQREIMNIYKDTIINLSEKAVKAKGGSLTERWAKDYMKELEEEVKSLQWQLSKSTKKGVLQAGKNAIEPDLNLFKQAQKKASIDLGDHFADMFSKVPNDILTVFSERLIIVSLYMFIISRCCFWVSFNVFFLAFITRSI
jgi:hypothetical protein